MSEHHRDLEPQRFDRARVKSTVRHALSAGKLISIPTRVEWLEDRGTRFAVRMTTQLARKAAAAPSVFSVPSVANSSISKPSAADSVSPSSAARPNPFQPYDEDLFVAELGARHVALLNKFNVVDDHVLIVTRDFERQQSPLTVDDFAALLEAWRGFPGLAFYNGGPAAGASQPHKHLQLIPWERPTDSPALPLDDWLAGDADRIASWNFTHAVGRWGRDATSATDRSCATLDISATALHSLYRALLERCGLAPASPDDDISPYNLLALPGVMVVVRRRCECFFDISLNSMAFAGGLLVKDDRQLDLLRQHGPWAALEAVAVSLRRDERDLT